MKLDEIRKRLYQKQKTKKLLSKMRLPQRETYRRWLLPFGIGLLGFVILILPTIIVLLPKGQIEGAVITEVETVFKAESIEVPSLEVSIKRSKTGEVETVPLESYVLSVVASEMPAEFEVEALKAQAVAARTYIVNHLLQQTDQADYIISDTTEHQVYKNDHELKAVWGDDFHWKWDKVSGAVLATEGEILTYDLAPITPTFFSMSNGYTENAEDYWGTALPYLKKVESKWEEDLPMFTEQKILSFAEVSEGLGVELSTGKTIPIKIERTSSGRVNEIDIADMKMSGREVREKLQLRSNDFTITQKNNHFIITTKGYGHGVGMSQYGANGMAGEGRRYEEILLYYYQGVELKLIKEAAATLVLK